LGSDIEARWIVEEATGERHPTTPPTRVTRARFDGLVERRSGGEPLQYVLGRWGFRTLDLMVDRRVLIPRPETEQVVEVALAEFDRRPAPAAPPAPADTPAPPPLTPAPAPPPPQIVDLGTGSGAIGLSIAAERPDVHVWATDTSAQALEVASANLAGLGGDAAARVRLAHGDWWDALPQTLRYRVDLVVANPPYIASRELDELDAEVVAWEPTTALHSGPTGLEAIERILGDAGEWLRPGAPAVIEIAPHQADQATSLAHAAGFTHVEVRPDLAGRDRVLVARTGETPDGPDAPGAPDTHDTPDTHDRAEANK
jgi:release factor glutamine methyltransferase